MKYGFGILLVILVLSSCSNRVDGVILDEELVEYYESFKLEAEARGIVFDNEEEQIEGYLQNIANNGVLGACRRNEDNDDNPAVFVDKLFWEAASDLEREYVVYHELGHCFLLRDHNDNADSTGTCISIMASGLGTCVDVYNENTRDKLIDELFDN